MMPIFMFGLGVALVVMIIAIGMFVAKDVTELIEFGYDPHGPRRGPIPPSTGPGTR